VGGQSDNRAPGMLISMRKAKIANFCIRFRWANFRNVPLSGRWSRGYPTVSESWTNRDTSCSTPLGGCVINQARKIMLGCSGEDNPEPPWPVLALNYVVWVVGTGLYVSYLPVLFFRADRSRQTSHKQAAPDKLSNLTSPHRRSGNQYPNLLGLSHCPF
jgi:hypothetical protein